MPSSLHITPMADIKGDSGNGKATIDNLLTLFVRSERQVQCERKEVDASMKPHSDAPLTLNSHSSSERSELSGASSPLPIPFSNNVANELSHHKEEQDKYDRSTWRMYHRIIDARSRKGMPRRKATSNTCTNLPNFPSLPKSRKGAVASITGTPSTVESAKEIFPIEI